MIRRHPLASAVIGAAVLAFSAGHGYAYVFGSVATLPVGSVSTFVMRAGTAEAMSSWVPGTALSTPQLQKRVDRLMQMWQSTGRMNIGFRIDDATTVSSGGPPLDFQLGDGINSITAPNCDPDDLGGMPCGASAQTQCSGGECDIRINASNPVGERQFLDEHTASTPTWPLEGGVIPELTVRVISRVLAHEMVHTMGMGDGTSSTATTPPCAGSPSYSHEGPLNCQGGGRATDWPTSDDMKGARAKGGTVADTLTITSNVRFKTGKLNSTGGSMTISDAFTFTPIQGAVAPTSVARPRISCAADLNAPDCIMVTNNKFGDLTFHKLAAVAPFTSSSIIDVYQQATVSASSVHAQLSPDVQFVRLPSGSLGTAVAVVVDDTSMSIKTPVYNAATNTIVRVDSYSLSDTDVGGATGAVFFKTPARITWHYSAQRYLISAVDARQRIWLGVSNGSNALATGFAFSFVKLGPYPGASSGMTFGGVTGMLSHGSASIVCPTHAPLSNCWLFYNGFTADAADKDGQATMCPFTLNISGILSAGSCVRSGIWQDTAAIDVFDWRSVYSGTFAGPAYVFSVSRFFPEANQNTAFLVDTDGYIAGGIDKALAIFDIPGVLSGSATSRRRPFGGAPSDTCEYCNAVVMPVLECASASGDCL